MVTLENLLGHPALQNGFLLKAFFTEAEKIPHSVFYAMNIIQRKNLYFSSSCETISGQHPQDFIDGGPDFFFQLVEESSIPVDES